MQHQRNTGAEDSLIHAQVDEENFLRMQQDYLRARQEEAAMQRQLKQCDSHHHALCTCLLRHLQSVMATCSALHGIHHKRAASLAEQY